MSNAGSLVTQEPPTGAVVAGVDGTENDALVLTAATAEALRRGAPLHLRHCREGVNPYALADISMVDWSTMEGMDGIVGDGGVLAVSLATVGELAPDLAVTADDPLGRPENRLVEASESAAMVVVGTGRRTTVDELVLGTVALNVAAHSRCPVLVVPKDGDPDGEGDVVVGVNGSEHSRAALAAAVREARLREARVVVLTVWKVEVVGGYVVTEPDSPEWHQVEERIGALQGGLLAEVDTEGVEVERRIVKGGIRDTLAEASAAAGLVVVGNRGRGGFRSKALGSLTMDLMKRSQCPLLVVHADG